MKRWVVLLLNKILSEITRLFKNVCASLYFSTPPQSHTCLLGNCCAVCVCVWETDTHTHWGENSTAVSEHTHMHPLTPRLSAVTLRPERSQYGTCYCDVSQSESGMLTHPQEGVWAVTYAPNKGRECVWISLRLVLMWCWCWSSVERTETVELSAGETGTHTQLVSAKI